MYDNRKRYPMGKKNRTRIKGMGLSMGTFKKVSIQSEVL